MPSRSSCLQTRCSQETGSAIGRPEWLSTLATPWNGPLKEIRKKFCATNGCHAPSMTCSLVHVPLRETVFPLWARIESCIHNAGGTIHITYTEDAGDAGDLRTEDLRTLSMLTLEDTRARLRDSPHHAPLSRTRTGSLRRTPTDEAKTESQ